eukprot:m.97711 g.97711  ORF g.97711 m.97711 type:complete len:549 (-) comp27003_c0_seq1:15-1661(-)
MAHVLPRRVEVTKGSDGFGFNLSKAEGRHYLRQVDDGGASFIGGARSGDRILAVNDISVVNKNHKELVAFIKAGGEKLNMILLASDQQMPIPPSARSITITRIASGFGFNLGRKGQHHFFKGVDAGGPTQMAGASLGDVIFEINGVAVTGLTHGDVVKLIKAGGAAVNMRIENPNFLSQGTASVPPPQQPTNVRMSSQHAMQTVMQARMRAEQAIIQRREQERQLHAAKLHEQKLQLIHDELASLDVAIKNAQEQLVFTTDQIVIQRGKTQKFATPREFKELDDNLLLIEAEAINELNQKQESLPIPPASADDLALGKVQIANKSWELEVAVTRQELSQSRFSELVKLLDIAKLRRSEEKLEELEEVEAISTRRAKDLITIEQRRKRFEEHLAQARARKDDDLAVAKAARERKEQDMLAEEKRRQALAAEVQRKLEQEDEALSFKEQARRTAETEEHQFLKKDEERLAKLTESRRALQEAEEQEAEEARQKNAASIFGVRMKKSGADFVDHDAKRLIHPMVSLLGDKSEKKSSSKGLTHLCKPPDTRM